MCARFGLRADCVCKRPGRFTGANQQADDNEEVSLNLDGQAAYLFHKIINEFLGHQENFEQEFPGMNASVDAKLHLLWVACGTDDGLLGINRDFNRWLTAQGVTHADVETQGNHTWMVWRRNLAAFALLLFR